METAKVFLKKLKLKELYNDIVELPPEVELAVRTENGKEYIFVLNYVPYAVRISLYILLCRILQSAMLKQLWS